MNANELLDIIKASTMCGEDSSCVGCPFEGGDCKAGYFEDGLYAESLKAFNELRDILNRSRIRVTKEEAPTFDDTTESKSGVWNVQAYNSKDGEWQNRDYIMVIKYAYIYTLWTQLPQLTEVMT